MTTAIAIRRLYKQFRQVEALRGVEFDIQHGEFFGLLGPNGAGKSTLINIMAGLTKATQGSVAVLGYDVVRDYRRTRALLGVVPQELIHDPFFSVREMLRWQSGYFGFGRENDPWIDELLHILELEDRTSFTLNRLSGGMKRRSLIAQALVHHPKVVVLDEPTAGVDVELRHTLWELAKRLHAEGSTIVLTTHYLHEAEALCERIAILNHGQLQTIDSKASLLARHPFRFLRVTLAGKAELPSSLQHLIASHTIREDRIEWVLKLHKQNDPIAPILEAFHTHLLPILDLNTQDPTLEDVFLELTHTPPVTESPEEKP